MMNTKLKQRLFAAIAGSALVVGGLVATSGEVSAVSTTPTVAAPAVTPSVERPLIAGIPALQSVVRPQAELHRSGRYFDLYLNRSETYALSKGWYTSALSAVPAPYSWLVKPYQWVMKNQAASYYNSGNCILIRFGPTIGLWTNPVPGYAPYRDNRCR